MVKMYLDNGMIFIISQLQPQNIDLDDLVFLVEKAYNHFHNFRANKKFNKGKQLRHQEALLALKMSLSLAKTYRNYFPIQPAI